MILVEMEIETYCRSKPLTLGLDCQQNNTYFHPICILDIQNEPCSQLYNENEDFGEHYTTQKHPGC